MTAFLKSRLCLTAIVLTIVSIGAGICVLADDGTPPPATEKSTTPPAKSETKSKKSKSAKNADADEVKAEHETIGVDSKGHKLSTHHQPRRPVVSSRWIGSVHPLGFGFRPRKQHFLADDSRPPAGVAHY